MSLKNLIGKRLSKTVKFMNEDVKITKLSVAEVLEIQEAAKSLDPNDPGFSILQKVVSLAVEGAGDLTEDDFRAFPMDELTKLSNEVMKFSGMNPGEQGK
jgi:hypothetical protein